ncbi:DUF4468 domain-containing protein [Thermodesulfobacteriota bacterium]
MKKLLFALLVILLVFGCVQQVKQEDLKIQKVYDVPGFKKDHIYSQTKIWIAENFKSAKAVIEHDDKDSGVLIGNGIIPYPCKGMECIAKGDWKVPFKMRVDVKDNKFRLTFTNLMLSIPSSYNSTFGYQKGSDNPIWQQSDLDAIKPVLLGFGGQITASLSGATKDKDW